MQYSPCNPCIIFTPELAPILVAPASIIFFISSKLRTPPDAFTPISGPTTPRISFTSSSVAPPVEKPVDVLTKSAPASTESSHAFLFSWSVNKEVSMITLTIALPFAASTTACDVVFNHSHHHRLRNAPILMTISISSAPFSIASFVSNAFTSLVEAPSGKPMTVHTLTDDPSSSVDAVFTQVGLTHTDAKEYFSPSSQSLNDLLFFCFSF